MDLHGADILLLSSCICEDSARLLGSLSYLQKPRRDHERYGQSIAIARVATLRNGLCFTSLVICLVSSGSGTPDTSADIKFF